MVFIGAPWSLTKWRAIRAISIFEMLHLNLNRFLCIEGRLFVLLRSVSCTTWVQGSDKIYPLSGAKFEDLKPGAGKCGSPQKGKIGQNLKITNIGIIWKTS